VSKVTIPQLQKMKDRGEKIAVLTAYDCAFARLFDRAGIDILLVGDSLGMVIQGHSSTLPVTLEQMAYHGQAVARGAARAHVAVDMPFGSYQVSTEKAVESAIRLVAEGGAESVKLEGGTAFAPTVEAIVRASVPVMGHLGLTPQSIHKLGGHVVQGRGPEAAQQLRQDALALEAAGCYAVVLEAIPRELAAEITASLRIPTIGIGAGAGCDGQVLVSYDLLGMDAAFEPRFVRRYAELAEVIGEAAALYLNDVKTARFPTEANAYSDRSSGEGDGATKGKLSAVRLAASGGEGVVPK
jgi:3-methyl-2-oxobutanoate hydroxymethyltransferase